MNNTKKTAIVISSAFVIIIVVMLALIPLERKNQLYSKWGNLAVLAETDERVKYIIDNEELYTDYLLQSLSIRPDEYIELVYNYPVHKNDYLTMKFTEDELNSDSVPALYMKDMRWAYEDDCTVKTNGCAAVAITMANLYLNHNSDVDPVKIMRFAYDNGYVGLLGGINADDIPLVLDNFGIKYEQYDHRDSPVTIDELKSAVDKQDTVVMIGMNGETFGGHAIILRGYDENGFYINDPNNEGNTAKVWAFDELKDELFMHWELTSIEN